MTFESEASIAGRRTGGGRKGRGSRTVYQTNLTRGTAINEPELGLLASIASRPHALCGPSPRALQAQVKLTRDELVRLGGIGLP